MFAPLVSRQVEAGGKADWGSWSSTLSVFQITQPSGITDPDSRIFGVDRKQRNRGMEWNVYGEPIRGYRILGGVAVLNCRQVKTATRSNEGKRAIGVPTYQANFGAELDVPKIDGLALSARLIKTGEQYVDAGNTQRLRAWTRVDAGLRYVLRPAASKPITVRLNVENVFNKRYWASAATGQAAGLSRGAPRTFILSTMFHF